MADLETLLSEAQQSGDLAALCAAVPCARFLGLSATADGDRVLTRLEFAPHLVGNPTLPALHGGVLGALAETAAVLEILWATRIPRLPKTISLTIEYLRSARAATTWAHGEITHHGRRVVTVRVLAYQDDASRPVVAANAHLLLAGE